MAAPSPHRKNRWLRILGIAALVLVALVFVASLVLDGFLTKRAQAEAATLSTKLGRPVRIERVSTSVFTGLGATVSGVEIGAGPGEDVPLLQLGSAEVKVAALRALFSLGKDIEVRSVELATPVVNVLRLPDGTTNVERLTDKLAADEPKKPETPSEPRDLSNVRVGHAAVTDGRIKLVDRSQRSGPARELAIQHLDLVVDDLRAGKSLDLVLKAAVLADAQNLELRVHTAPLPNTLQPTPERIVLRVSPVDLAPVGPFLPKDARLEAGRLDADWTAELGAAVPGGKGPTTAKGGIHLRGAKFAGTGAAPIDVALDTDLSGNVEAGDLDLRTLALSLGPAGLTGKGRVQGLASQTPSVQGLEVVGHDLDPAVLAKYFPPLARALKGQAAGPIGLVLRGAGTQAAPSVELALDFTPVRLAVPLQLAKAAGAPMTLAVRLLGAGKDTYRFEANAKLDGVDLRPGLLLDKPPGKTLALSAQGTAQRGAATKVTVEGWTLNVLADTMTGTASVEQRGQGKKATTTFQLAAKSARVDADALLLETDQKAPTPPPADPHRYDGLRGTVHVEVASLVFHKLPWKDLVLDASMQDDLLTVQKLSLDAAGGQLRADGTTVRLGPVDRPFDLKLTARALDLAQALTFGGKGKAFSGSFDGTVALAGRGTTLDSLEKTLSGKVDGLLKNGAFLGTDLVASVAGPLASVLPFATKKLGTDGKTSLGEQLRVALAVENGVARLTSPVTIDTPAAALKLGGGIGLSGKLDLGGTVALTPATIQTLTGGKVKPGEPIPLALTLSGPAWAPQVGGLDVKPAALTIAKLAGASGIKSLLGNSGAGQALGNALGGIGGGSAAGSPGGTGDAQKEAQDRAASEAERLRKQAQDEAAKRLKGLFGK